MTSRRDSSAGAVVIALAVLLTACGSGNDKGLATSSTGDLSPPAEEPDDGAGADDDGQLVRCEDIEELESRVEGNYGSHLTYNHDVMGLVRAHRDEYQDSYGGHWLDQENGGAVVLAVTDDPETHRQQLQDLLSGTGAAFDVVQVEFTLAELRDIQAQMRQHMGDQHGLLSTGISQRRNRVSLDFFDPPEGTLETFAELVDPSAVCVNLAYSPEPPSGPLSIIPNLDDEDPLVTCIGIGPVRNSSLTNPVPIDQVDHPAVEALRSHIGVPGDWTMPEGDWHAIEIGEQRAVFAANNPPGYSAPAFSFATAVFERTARDRWLIVGSGIHGPCEPVVVLPDGLGRVEARLNPDSLPAPEDTAIDLLAVERGCWGGRETNDTLLGPQVIETDEAVLVAFAVISRIGPTNSCLEFRETPYTVQLSRPLGQRTLYDGLQVPPKPLTADLVW